MSVTNTDGVINVEITLHTATIHYISYIYLCMYNIISMYVSK